MNTFNKSEEIKSIQWKDLVSLSHIEICYELILSIPWLIASLYLAQHKHIIAGLACSFMFFLTGLRQVHNAFHYSLGITREMTELVMFVLSGLMLGSMHAIQINHLRHHRYCMSEEDIEASCAKLPALKAILIGPLFPIRLHIKAIEVGNIRQIIWIIFELFLSLLIVIYAYITPIFWIKFHISAMLIGQCLTSFFAVWTVHHHCQEHRLIARTIRNRLKAVLTYNMFYHVEHHLFPSVPTCRLHILASRVDKIAPEQCIKKVF